MSDTRLHNQRGEYTLNQGQFQDTILNYTTAPYKRISSTNVYPDLGIQLGQRPVNTLSYNPIETENYLYGIHSTDLTQNTSPYKNFRPRPKCHEWKPFFERTPVIMPEPLVVLKHQRPEKP